mgnify:CR=1 FL=1
MKILVTGGTGFIASWIIKYLLEEGHEVNTTVRDISNKEKTRHLTSMATGAEGTLQFFEADLMKEGSFDEAVQGCESVIHTASPFFITGIKDARRQLIEPAVKGTRNVIESAGRQNSVKKIVVTSSVAAIHGDNADIRLTKANRFNEENWNKTSNEKHQAYSYSKTAAEKEAWRLYEQQNQWELAVINPGFVLGPSLTPRTDSTSIGFIKSLLDGTYKQGVPELYFGIVDVRNVARAHVVAATTPNAKGRHLLVAKTMATTEIAQILSDYVGESYPVPRKSVPKLLLYILGPAMGFSWKYIGKNVGIPILFDNTRAREQLGIAFTDPVETIREQADQLMQDGAVEKK